MEIKNYKEQITTKAQKKYIKKYIRMYVRIYVQYNIRTMFRNEYVAYRK